MQERTAATETPEPTSNQFTTFGGVFTPSILTILGVIMFMRTGFVTGQAGIGAALLILLIAKVITFLTGLSISAVSTNTKVEGGGAYYLISRSLGPEFGGAIGLALFLAQALSVPFYILGFAEALTTTFPQLAPEFLLLGLFTTTMLFVINYIGAGWAIKAQYFILAILVCAVITFLGGAILEFEPATVQANWDPEYTTGNDFWVIFAVFFPAVTGIMAGVNMSGDLAEPEKSIPRGTIAAIIVGGLVYGLQAVITGGSTSRGALINDPYGSLMDQALFGMDFFIIAGVFAATLSSAIGSMLGAPRILQALARDDIFPGLGYFAKGTVQGDEPRRGLWLTFFMTIGVLLYAGNDSGGGALNAVAVVLTMFFLFTYGMTNVAAFIEQFSGNPSFRPRFKYFHWVTALLGGLGCFGAALLINPLAALISFAIVTAVFIYISQRVLETSFGDARRGFYYQRVRTNLRKLASHPPHPKNWRPTTLVLSGNPKTRFALTKFASWLESGRGIVTLAQVLEGDFHENIKRRREAQYKLQKYISENRLEAFAEVVVSESFDDGLSVLLQSHSIGPLKPNVVMIGWPSRPRDSVAFAQHLRLALELGMSQVIVVDRGMPAEQPEQIDVWWRGRKNGSLMVILAYLLTHNWTWSRARIRLLRMLEGGETMEEAEEELEALIDAARLEADYKVVEAGDFKQRLKETSSDADCVFLGFTPPSDEHAEAFHAAYTDFVEDLPTTLIVCSSGEADLYS
jgi:amino acid transporter